MRVYASVGGYYKSVDNIIIIIIIITKIGSTFDAITICILHYHK